MPESHISLRSFGIIHSSLSINSLAESARRSCTEYIIYMSRRQEERERLLAHLERAKKYADRINAVPTRPTLMLSTRTSKKADERELRLRKLQEHYGEMFSNTSGSGYRAAAALRRAAEAAGLDSSDDEDESDTAAAAVVPAAAVAAAAAAVPVPQPPAAGGDGTTFLDLPEDILSEIFRRLHHPLLPHCAIGLASCCKLARALLRNAAARLRVDQSSAIALADKAGTTLSRLAGASRLSWSQKHICQLDMQSLGELAIHLPHLVEVDLRYNRIGDAGLHALAQASARGSLPELRNLAASSNGITDEGIQALATIVCAFPYPAFKSLEQLSLNSNVISSHGMAALAMAIGEGALPQLRAIQLAGNPADDAVVQQALTSPSEMRRYRSESAPWECSERNQQFRSEHMAMLFGQAKGLGQAGWRP